MYERSKPVCTHPTHHPGWVRRGVTTMRLRGGRQRRAKRGATLAALVRARLDRLDAGDLDLSWSQARQTPPPPSSMDKEARLDAVLRLVEEREVGRAAHLLTSEGLADLSPAVLAQLGKLWHSGARHSAPTGPKSAPSSAALVAAHLRESLSRSTLGSGAGRSGWRFEHLLQHRDLLRRVQRPRQRTQRQPMRADRKLS